MKKAPCINADQSQMQEAQHNHTWSGLHCYCNPLHTRNQERMMFVGTEFKKERIKSMISCADDQTIEFVYYFLLLRSSRKREDK